jgi:ABC-type antimicrobial peptide transport system permease subunit
MTQELVDLKNSIREGRYADALMIVDELEGMSKQANLRQLKSFLRIMLIHLIKNQLEQRLTNSWAASIRNAIREIKSINIKDNKKSYYINQDEWSTFIEEEVIEDAIADASLEVLNGKFTRSQLSAILDRNQILTTATGFLALTYTYSAKELPAIMDDYLAQLPGGQDWISK